MSFFFLFVRRFETNSVPNPATHSDMSATRYLHVRDWR